MRCGAHQSGPRAADTQTRRCGRFVMQISGSLRCDCNNLHSRGASRGRARCSPANTHTHTHTPPPPSRGVSRGGARCPLHTHTHTHTPPLQGRIQGWGRCPLHTHTHTHALPPGVHPGVGPAAPTPSPTPPRWQGIRYETASLCSVWVCKDFAVRRILSRSDG